MMMNSFKFSWKIEFMKVVKVNDTLHDPNGMFRNSYEHI